MSFIPYGRQSISKDDIEKVKEVLCSDWLTQGPSVQEFEQKMSDYCKANYAFAVCNATAALHLAYLALDVQRGDIVWTSPNTFVATANAALMCGATVDFVDICSESYNLSVEVLENKLVKADQEGKLPKVVTSVHFAGQSCDMKGIYQLSLKYGFKIIEDASHAVGGKYLDQPVGSCLYSDICIFSFHPVKIITTGEGGMLLTNNAILAEKINLLRTHGITRNEKLMTLESEGDWYYQMVMLGFNYRITDIQCALGISQLERLDQLVAKRHEVFQIYRSHFEDCDQIRLPKIYDDSYSALHLYPIWLSEGKRKKLFDYLRANEIGVNVHYIPVYLQPYYQKLGFEAGYCPNAERYYRGAISLPMFADLTENQITYVVNQVKKGLEICA